MGPQVSHAGVCAQVSPHHTILGPIYKQKKKVMTSGRYTSRHRASPFDIGEVVVMCTMWCNSIWDRGCKPIRIVELHPAKLHLVTPKYTKRRTTPYFGIVFPLEV